MKRPSIFSKNYEKEVKKRRKKIFLLIIVPIIGLSIFLIADFDIMLNKGISMKKSINNIFINKSKQDAKIDENKALKVQNEEKVVKPKTDIQKPKDTQAEVTEKIDTDSKILAVSLSDGKEISVEYSLQGAEKNIEGVTNSKDILYDISPSKKSIVIQSKTNQDIIYFDINKNTKDITKKTYISSKGKVYSKENKVKKAPDYIWSIMPKFIDEENVVYVSELPWMNDASVHYIWKVNLKNNIHTQVKPAKGKSITFKNITSKGLETIIDGNSVYVNSSGKVVK